MPRLRSSAIGEGAPTTPRYHAGHGHQALVTPNQPAVEDPNINPTTLTDEELFDRYRRGERELLRVLVDRHEAELMRFLYRLLGDRQAAEDVFQEAFLQAHLSAGTFDASRRFRPWLFTIAANKGRDHLRKKGRRVMHELSAPVGGRSGSEGASFIDLMEVDVAGPAARLDDEERGRLVQRSLDRLSPALREVLLLAYFQRLSYAQIAEDLDIPLGTVKSRLHAAVAAFGKQWREATTTSTDNGKAGS